MENYGEILIVKNKNNEIVASLGPKLIFCSQVVSIQQAW